MSLHVSFAIEHSVANELCYRMLAGKSYAVKHNTNQLDGWRFLFTKNSI